MPTSFKKVWVVHFSREDSVLIDPYWPSNELQEKRLNTVYFWHDKDFQKEYIDKINILEKQFLDNNCEIGRLKDQLVDVKLTD